MNFVDWIIIFVSILLVAVVALQSSKGDLGEAITGGANSELFKNQKERGPELFFSRVTLVLTILLVVLTIVRNYV
jgi:preprotein translocase subunit SecG